MLIGRGAGAVAGAIAEGLIQNEVGAFRIHVADSLGSEFADRLLLWHYTHYA